MRMRNKPWAEQELQTNKNVVKQPIEQKGKWSEYFGNDYPIHIEIGCGKGRFIIENAKRYKDVNFIGIERQTTVIAIAARKIEQYLPNLALVCDSAAKLSDLYCSLKICLIIFVPLRFILFTLIYDMLLWYNF